MKTLGLLFTIIYMGFVAALALIPERDSPGAFPVKKPKLATKDSLKNVNR
jgi:hypothetical protein